MTRSGGVCVVLILSVAGGAFARGGQTVWAGIYSNEQATRGEAAYRAACASCHLETLKGNDTAPALTGDAFLREWNSRTVRELYGRILTTMPADDPGSVAEQTVLDIVAYVLQSNGFPAGDAVLASPEQAERITITRERP